jgi:hypothetical protein
MTGYRMLTFKKQNNQKTTDECGNIKTASKISPVWIVTPYLLTEH